jgi:hypothetical protein
MLRVDMEYLASGILAVPSRMPATRAAFWAWATLIAAPSSLYLLARIGANDLRPHGSRR